MFSGRIDRDTYSWAVSLLLLPLVVVIIIGAVNSTVASFMNANVVFRYVLAVYFVVAWPVIAGLNTRRLHDMNRPWLDIFIPFPFVPFMWLYNEDGTQGPNKYGPPVTPKGFKQIYFGTKPTKNRS